MFTLFFINQYRTMMKRVTFLTLLFLTVMGAAGQTYLDPQAPIEQRVEDALGRMTLHEKIGVLHAQSKFTSAGVPRLGIRQLNMDDGPHGVREELDWNEWEWLSIMAGLFVTANFLLRGLAIALVAPPATDRVRPLRLTLVGLWFAWLAVVFVESLAHPPVVGSAAGNFAAGAAMRTPSPPSIDRSNARSSSAA